MDTTTTTQQPIHSIRLGRLKAAIWANTTPKGVRYSVTLDRTFRDGEDYKTSRSLDRRDLLPAAWLTQQALAWMVQAENEARESEAEQPAAFADAIPNGV